MTTIKVTRGPVQECTTWKLRDAPTGCLLRVVNGGEPHLRFYRVPNGRTLFFNLSCECLIGVLDKSRDDLLFALTVERASGETLSIEER